MTTNFGWAIPTHKHLSIIILLISTLPIITKAVTLNARLSKQKTQGAFWGVVVKIIITILASYAKTGDTPKK